jgi:6-phosphogluconolactonase
LTPTVAGVVSCGNGPTSVAVDPSSKFAYVVNRGDNTLSMYVINSSTGDLTANGTIATGTEPFAVVVDPSGKFAYVTNESGSVSIYTLNGNGTLTSAGTATAGSGPISMAVTAAK